MSPTAILRYFDPTAATASMFLYAQGNSVVCCHHDTLTIERRFSRHDDEVQILAVDNQSELGAGRLVVSYDAGQTAIVWDIMSGEEVARFASYEHLTVAAWMRNGNVAFGNTQGNIILFEPTTSEHISARTIDQIAVTALAPSADCRTFAIGYQNGSLLIATLQPRFTILHNLTTSRAPSPIISLSWHASSSRQKSDMLAVQTNDGDLRVWSVSKAYNSADPAKVVRILKKSENCLAGPNWMGWSKNGRIIQHSESETLSWDVRTKHVTFDKIPTLEHTKGLAVYGPGASLFTIAANNTVQQFDLNAPAMMVANVQHPANLLPPSPPVSIEEQEKGASTASESEMGSIQISADISESDEDAAPPMARIARAGNLHQSSDEDQYRTASPASSGISDVSSTSSRTPGRYQASLRSRGMTDNTYISTGSSIRSSTFPQEKPKRESSSMSTSSLSSVSMGSSTSRSRHRPSRLRHEIPRSPEDSRVVDLFKFTRTRLSDVPYKRPPMVDNSRLTNDDLRRQMLCTIFGWTKEAEDLVRDEMSRHPQGTPSRILLAKWLGDIDPDIMTANAENMTSSDWMLLALSGIGGTAAQHKLGLAYVQRLLETGDIHSAVTIMIGMGDQTDAIEVYISHKKYLEALILTCLFFPSVWERQAQIVKKWGEWAVQHGHQQLAIRCFACSGKESDEPWTSPSAQQMTFQSINTAVNPSIPEVLSPPLSPPGLNRGPQRSIAKTSALKLITSFGDQNSKSKFFSTNDGGQTPIAAGVTPIAESAISPRAEDMTTAFLRPSNRSAFNTPTTARSQTSNFGRGRLPSIGEMPSDANLRSTAKKSSAQPPQGIDALTPPIDSPARQGHRSKKSTDEEYTAMGMSLERAATASPMMMKNTHRRKEAPPPSPSPDSLAILMQSGRRSRNGPRERMPSGLELQLQSLDNAVGSDVTSPEQSVTSSTRFHWPTRRRAPPSVASSTTSASAASSVARGPRGHQGGKSLDDYISSLEAAKTKSRGGSREGRNKTRDGSATRKGGSRERSGDRGRTASRGYTPRAGKRSPTSPVPMSPEDLLNLSTPNFNSTRYDDRGREIEEPATVRKASTVRATSRSRPRRGESRDDMRPAPLEIPRGRSNDRQGSGARSPSSPLPMSAGVQHYFGSEDEEDYRRAKEDQAKFRSRKALSRGGSKSREPSPGLPMTRESSKAREPQETRSRTPRVEFAVSGRGDLKAIKDERQLKKEAAARELEERRKSLAKRPLAPPIPHPDELSPSFPGASIQRAPTAFELPSTTFVQPKELPPRSRTAEPDKRSMYAQQPTRPFIGLPATPKAMRLVMEGQKDISPDEPVPPIPTTFAQAESPRSRQNSPQKETSSPQAAEGQSLLTLLPSTVYQPPSRPGIQRCMSAPPEEPVAPQALQGDGSFGHSRLTRGQSLRKLSTPDAHSAHKYNRTIDGVIDDNLVGRSSHSRRTSNADQIPPPPPPPPVLKELQHLAIPPPPPPAPLPFAHGGKPPVVYGASGTIEIVMDNDDSSQSENNQKVQPLSETTVPVIAPPNPPRGHHRGRSSVDNSIAGRISRATERMRSGSRSRNNSSVVSRTKSPIESAGPAPYESIPLPPKGPPVSFHNRELKSPIDGRTMREEFDLSQKMI
ncbi:hypothetical protein J7T55_006794 [Diaporthe amygdali]|uniref:uncharacterized protein n=1 Tax=Phomopsis amygdali TaxID=1214568 RepID=UPI0022FE8D5F|nr:uncharacterized protein J7T55_006794 [Diaporthe amygdali]KAJ0125448.1 hypothetical protein J7T55_006794 [Diaporthe amygdali]